MFLSSLEYGLSSTLNLAGLMTTYGIASFVIAWESCKPAAITDPSSAWLGDTGRAICFSKHAAKSLSLFL
jgi:hypothetical protein